MKWLVPFRSVTTPPFASYPRTVAPACSALGAARRAVLICHSVEEISAAVAVASEAAKNKAMRGFMVRMKEVKRQGEGSGGQAGWERPREELRNGGKSKTPFRPIRRAQAAEGI